MPYLVANNPTSAASNGISANTWRFPIYRNFGYTMSSGRLATITFDAATDNPFGSDTSITVAAYTKPYTARVRSADLQVLASGTIGYVGDVVNTQGLDDANSVFTANGITYTPLSRCTISSSSTPGTGDGQAGNSGTRIAGIGDATLLRTATPGMKVRIAKQDGTSTVFTTIAGVRYVDDEPTLLYFTTNISTTIVAGTDSGSSIEIISSDRNDVAATGLWELYSDRDELITSN